MKPLRLFKKIKLKTIPSVDVVIFDLSMAELLEASLAKYTVYRHPARSEVIYLSFPVLFSMLKIAFQGWRLRLYRKYFISFRDWLSVSYHLACMRRAQPKLVVSFIDNSVTLSVLTDVMADECRFIAIQNGTRWFRHICLGYPYAFDILMSFSRYEPYLLNLMGHRVGKAIPVGSFRLSLAKQKFDFEQCMASPVYDLCFISGYRNYNNQFDWMGHYCFSMDQLCKEFAQFLHQNPGYSACIALAGNSQSERDYMQNIFGDRVTLIAANRQNQLSYKAVFESEVIVGMNSTLLLEALAIDKKVLFANLGKCLDHSVPFSYKYKVAEKHEFEPCLRELLKISRPAFQATRNLDDLVDVRYQADPFEVLEAKLASICNGESLVGHDPKDHCPSLMLQQ